VPDFLYYGDTRRSAAMRHELPIEIIDSFLLAVVDGRTHVLVSSLERERVAAAAPDAVLHDMEDLGLRELMGSGLSFHEIDLELASRAAAEIGLRIVIADPELPVAVADRLRADSVEIRPDQPAIAARRRQKSTAELAGIRRAQIAAEAGMRAAAELLAESQPDGGDLRAGDELVTSERVRAALRQACSEHGAPTPPDVIVSSVRSGYGHDPGSGPLPADSPIVIDLWPQDEQSGCWADMTRTFVVGEIPAAVRDLEALVRDALERARAAVRPGISGRELHAIACDIFEAAGQPTQRTDPGDDADAGFQFSLGHGVGLDVHEGPALGMTGREALVAGDVIAIEPGIWQPGLGEVRLEDLLLVTEDGCETLTRYAYDLTP
jgi:Xaa-Pro aminopeptidase